METAVPPEVPTPGVSLAELRIGDRGRLLVIPAVEARVALLQMGVPPGAVVTLTNRAPSGCPLAIQVHGTKLALRQELARQIRVERLPA